MSTGLVDFASCVGLGRGLVSLLSAQAALRSLCYDDARGFRMSPVVLPQGETLPAIVYHEISSDDEAGIGGRMGVRHTRVQFDCYADSDPEAEDVRNALEKCLTPGGNPYRGPAGDELILCAVPSGGYRSDAMKQPDGLDRYQYIRSVDFLISHRIAVL